MFSRFARNFVWISPGFFRDSFATFPRSSRDFSAQPRRQSSSAWEHVDRITRVRSRVSPVPPRSLAFNVISLAFPPLRGDFPPCLSLRVKIKASHCITHDRYARKQSRLARRACTLTGMHNVARGETLIYFTTLFHRNSNNTMQER